MQNTRLTTLINRTGETIQQQLRNPWRRLALMIIALLFGIYLGAALASTAGQVGYIDIVASAIVAIASEILSAIFYGNRWNLQKTLFGETLNAMKVGVLYGLFLIAFLLGS